MTRIAFSTFALACTLAGCASPQQQAFTPDSTPHRLSIVGCSMEERAQILRAVNEWNAAGAYIEVTSTQDADKVAVCGVAQTHGKAAVTVARSTIGLPAQDAAADFCGLAKHELGHSLGAGHSNSGVMRPHVGPWTRCGG